MLYSVCACQELLAFGKPLHQYTQQLNVNQLALRSPRYCHCAAKGYLAPFQVTFLGIPIQYFETLVPCQGHCYILFVFAKNCWLLEIFTHFWACPFKRCNILKPLSPLTPFMLRVLLYTGCVCQELLAFGKSLRKYTQQLNVSFQLGRSPKYCHCAAKGYLAPFQVTFLGIPLQEVQYFETLVPIYPLHAKDTAM